MYQSLIKLKAIKAQQNKSLLRQTVQAAKAKQTLTPEAVRAFAALHVVDDRELPIVPAAHHDLWVQLFCDTRIEKQLIIAPPGSAKTTWLLMAYAACYIGFYPENNLIIASASGAVAARRGLSLRTMIESDLWQATFPTVKPVKSMKWEQIEWSVAENGQPRPGRMHPTMTAYGTGGPIIGSRADLLIADDFLDFENTRTAHLRQTNTNWFHNTFLNRSKAGGRVIVIGTSWSHDDAYARIRQGSGWVICHMPLMSTSSDVYAYMTYPDDWQYETLGEPLTEDVLSALNPEAAR